MTAVSGTTQYTPAEIARLSDQDGKLYELVDGQLVEKGVDTSLDGTAFMSMRSNSAAAEIVVLLRSTYPLSKAYIFVEQPTYCFNDPNLMRRPDLSLVWAERLPCGLSDDELAIPPDLVIEVVSPTNTFNGIFGRVEEYLAAGVTIVWLVEPKRRHIHVYRKDGTIAIYRAPDVLKDEPLLPGLTVRVTDLFPAVTPLP